MSVDDFLDTNVFVYLFDETAPGKRQVADSLVQRGLADGRGCISYQVIQEAMNVLVGRLGATPEQMRKLMDDVLFPLWRVDPSRTLYRRGLDVRARYDSPCTTASSWRRRSMRVAAPSTARICSMDNA